MVGVTLAVLQAEGSHWRPDSSSVAEKEVAAAHHGHLACPSELGRLWGAEEWGRPSDPLSMEKPGRS